jgi:hypothetical protein
MIMSAGPARSRVYIRVPRPAAWAVPNVPGRLPRLRPGRPRRLARCALQVSGHGMSCLRLLRPGPGGPIRDSDEFKCQPQSRRKRSVTCRGPVSPRGRRPRPPHAAGTAAQRSPCRGGRGCEPDSSPGPGPASGTGTESRRRPVARARAKA